MLIKENEIKFVKCWFVASKHVKEENFLIQQCRIAVNEREDEAGLLHKQRLWNAFNTRPAMSFYFFQLDIPLYQINFSDL